MTDKTIQFFWIFIFLFAHCLSNAQERDSPCYIFDRADSLFVARDFARAALEYERVIYRAATTPDVVNTALFGRVQCFKQMQQFDKASEELLRVRLFTLNPSQAADYYYEKILCYYLSGSFNEARGAIDEMYFNMPDSAACNATLLLQAFIYNELQQWDEARQAALIYARTLPSPQQESMEAMIEQLYAKKNLPKLKRRNVSKVLSFVPGLAHIYTGHWAEGSISFLLNSAALGIGVYEVWHGYYVTGYFLGAGILSATYFGGFSRSAFLLQKYNDEVVRLFNNHVKKELLAQ